MATAPIQKKVKLKPVSLRNETPERVYLNPPRGPVPTLAALHRAFSSKSLDLEAAIHKQRR